jgi:hypothetical protein
VELHDSRGSFVPKSISLTIVTVLGITTSDPLRGGTIGMTNYFQRLNATCGVTPYNWSVVGSMPPGLSLSSNGTVTGTLPSTAGWYYFTAKVTDGSNILLSFALVIAFGMVVLAELRQCPAQRALPEQD